MAVQKTPPTAFTMQVTQQHPCHACQAGARPLARGTPAGPWHAVCTRHGMRTGTRRTLLVLGILAVVAVAARLAAPFAVERYVNRALADMGEYTGSVTDIELNLIRGGYVLHNLEIV